MKPCFCGSAYLKWELERLGGRLVEGRQPDSGDLELLREVLDEYGWVLEAASLRVKTRLGEDPTPRVKSLGTTLEKLQRNRGTGFRNMLDLAGMRIVNRRENPVHGYRAVYVIAFPDRTPVEI